MTTSVKLRMLAWVLALSIFMGSLSGCNSTFEDTDLETTLESTTETTAETTQPTQTTAGDEVILRGYVTSNSLNVRTGPGMEHGKRFLRQ